MARVADYNRDWQTVKTKTAKKHEKDRGRPCLQNSPGSTAQKTEKKWESPRK
jgi:hypothetical protein